jgi:hypothetical protein
MNSEIGLFALMLAPVASMISAYYSLQVLKTLSNWFNFL